MTPESRSDRIGTRFSVSTCAWSCPKGSFHASGSCLRAKPRRIAGALGLAYTEAMPSLVALANPTRFLEVSGRLLPWLGAAAALALGVGLWLALFVAPADYQQGDSVRIMFIHVPAAWLAMACYALMAVSSLGSLVWRHPLADVSAKAAAPLGAAFTALALVTGSIWGKPMWGAWWVWDARLTSVLVLFLMYLGLIALWRAFDEPSRAGRMAAVLTLVGFVNIPIIKFSVDWWNTLHQPASVLRLDGPTIHPSILAPLLVMALGFTLAFLALHLAAMRAEIYRRRVRAAERMAASQPRRPMGAPLPAE
jgi:heme exporter protein C